MKLSGMLKLMMAASLLASCSLQNSIAPIASATPLPSTGMLRPGDILDDMLLTTEQGDTPWIWDHCHEGETQIIKCDIPPFSKLFIGYGNIAGDMETLNAEWPQTTWRLFLDGHPVDLPAFGTKDYDVGQKLRLWNIVLEQVTPGEHSLNYIYTFANETTDVTWLFTVAAPASSLELPGNARELAFQGTSDKFTNLEEFGSS